MIFSSHIDFVHVALPLGISFYTFQAISYTVDVYRGEIKPQKSLYKLALYITLFPQLIAGPIVKYHDIADQIENRDTSLEQFYQGLRRFIIGLSRKVLIANTLGIVVDRIIYLHFNDVTPELAWLCAILFSFQIYNDFGGYADMAIGLCAMFGFKIKDNFNFPLISRSYPEFWSRWHISLGSWVKEYIYIPLGGNRCKPIRHYFNIFISFFIIGIWHGANFNMILLGLLNGIIVILEKLTGWNKPVSNKIMIVIHHIYMVIILAVTFFLLRSPDITYTMVYFKRFIGIREDAESIYNLSYFINGYDIIVLIIALLGAVTTFKNILNQKNIFVKTGVDIALIILLILSISAIATSTYNPFIYFRF